MSVPFKYTIKNFRTRKLTTIVTITGIMLVAFVFTAVLMMSNGIKKTMVATGSPDNVMILRKASNSEITSIIDPETQNVIRTLPNIATASDGNPVISNEPVVIINLEIMGGGMSNLAVRGVSTAAMTLRPQVKITEGRMFNPAMRELIVGEAVAKRFKDAQIGSSIKFAGAYWKIVGLFKTGGSGFDSELWGDARQILAAFNRGNTVSIVALKLDNMSNYEKL